ncbi:MAG: hypothetical protein HY320_07415 [Armatimonadetes bacterium]|nr:hypothetical protein [Armatimonadota bacterium]
MAVVKRRLDICGRERIWEYVVEAAGRQYRVEARQIGRGAPAFRCSCGISLQENPVADSLACPDGFSGPCTHIREAQRELAMTQRAAANMLP